MKGPFFYGDASFIAIKNRSDRVPPLALAVAQAEPEMARPGAKK
jgi:hypothetical protein